MASLHLIRMSVWRWEARFKRDECASYLWVDGFKRRLCLIWGQREDRC